MKILLYGFLSLISIFCLLVTITHFMGTHDHGNIRRAPTYDTIFLDTNKKLVTYSWKDNQLWLLVRDIKPEDSIESYTLYAPQVIFSRDIIINEMAIR